MISEQNDLSAFIAERERVFVPPELQKGIEFLLKNHAKGGGWAQYSGLPMDIHHTALVIDALARTEDSRFAGRIADTSAKVRENYEEHLKELDLEQLSDLLVIVKSEDEPHVDFVSEIGKFLEKSIAQQFGRSIDTGVQTVCKALTALSDVPQPSKKLISVGCEKLLQIQNTDDGGWPPIGKEASSIFPTALALEALTQVKCKDRAKALERGIQYIDSELRQHGWESLATGQDVFAQAMVLKALAETRGSLFEVNQLGVESLRGQVNADGGWGGDRENQARLNVLR